MGALDRSCRANLLGAKADSMSRSDKSSRSKKPCMLLVFSSRRQHTCPKALQFQLSGTLEPRIKSGWKRQRWPAAPRNFFTCSQVNPTLRITTWDQSLGHLNFFPTSSLFRSSILAPSRSILEVVIGQLRPWPRFWTNQQRQTFTLPSSNECLQ